MGSPWIIFASIDTLVARTVDLVEQKEKEKMPVEMYDQATQSYSIRRSINTLEYSITKCEKDSVWQ